MIVVFTLAMYLSVIGSFTAEGREVPGRGYFLAFRAHYDGDYRTSFKAFRAASRTGVRSTFGSWIDSICYHAMMGECHYQMGDLGPALEQYEVALNVFLANSTWLQRINFPPSVTPSTSPIRGTITWGVSSRPSQIGYFPDTMPSLQGRIDTDRVIQQGGVFATAKLIPVNVHEVIRCTALAMRRRLELLGPACPHDPLSQNLVNALITRPGPINHWSRSWVSVQLGLALAGLGRIDEAISELESAVLVAGQFDHPLTATTLLELGKLAARTGRLEVAAVNFLDATLAAAEFEQPDLMEEAFRHGLSVHLAAHQEPYAPLVAAANWAKVKRFQQLYASLLLLAAENQFNLNKMSSAQSLLSGARRALGRQDMLRGQLGAQYQYVSALVGFHNRKSPQGAAALASLLQFQQKASRRLFQIAAAERLYASGAVSARVADTLYETVLREPSVSDWLLEPVESLTLTTSDYSDALEHWFLAGAIERNSPERAIEIADRIRRHRFYSGLTLGGRLLALRWILEGPPEALTQESRLRRDGLRLKYPKYEALSNRAQQVRDQLAGLRVTEDQPANRELQSKLLRELDQTSQQQETILREIALRREPAELIFPPQHSTKRIQEALVEGELALIFFATSQSTHAIMLSRDTYAVWQLSAPAKLNRSIAAVLRAVGNLDANKPVPSKVIASDNWKKLSSQLLSGLVEEKQRGFWNRFPRLTIVPDGPLWNVPFDALQIAEGEQTVPLRDKMRIRYLPTASLIVPDGRQTKKLGNTAVVVGKMYPSVDLQVAQQAFDAMSDSLPGAVTLSKTASGPTGVLRSVWDRLIVLDEISPYGREPFDWSPAQVDSGKTDAQLARWLSLPWGGPDQVVLPGFQTSAAGSYGRSARSGDPFMSACGLMATGARTILLSRWRTGGQSSLELTHQFVKHLPDSDPVEAWHRSVDTVSEKEFNADSEPRLPSGIGQIKGDHPFLWSGYMLIDVAGRPAVDEVPGLEPEPVVADAEDT